MVVCGLSASTTPNPSYSLVSFPFILPAPSITQTHEFDFAEEDAESFGLSESAVVTSTATLGEESPRFFILTPDSLHEAKPLFGDVTPPNPPRRPLLGSSQSAPADGGVAARRAAAGKLSANALVHLQKMSFEALDAGMGLGVVPGSPGFEGMEGVVAPVDGVSPGAAAGMSLRLALGLSDGKDLEPNPYETENFYSAPNSPSLVSPSLRQWSMSSLAKSKWRPYSRTPPSPSPTSPSFDPIKIPLTLRGSKNLDKLNLSPRPWTSPLHRGERTTSSSPAPPSPLIFRTSALNTIPLPPLTPSHIPGAPSLSGASGGFDWFSYSTPDSPNCPSPPIRSVFHEGGGITPRQAFFHPTHPVDPVHPSTQRSFSMQLR